MEHITLTVLGLAGLLGLAALMLPVARRLKIPYTVLLAVAGALLGVVKMASAGVHGPGMWNDFLSSLQSFRITSETVLYIFIPALVFESALSINSHRLMEDLVPILVLAIVGLVVSTIIIGGSVYTVVSAGWVACLLLGAILSATDPVAVVAIFKELQAPKRLGILVEGESLFNDATAIVLFTLLSGMILKSEPVSYWNGALEFFKVFLGGVLTGGAGGWLLCLIYRRMGKFPVVEVTLTITLAYLAFLTAEHYLHVSGVMAVVSAALVLGARGRAVVSNETWGTLKEIWEYIGFGANSLIFILVGLAIPEIIRTMNGGDYLALAVVIGSAFTGRAFILYGMLPLFERLKWIGSISVAYQTVMFWGGLRGAVSLALALAVMENHAYPESVRHLIGVLVTGFVLFTLLVNATTIGWVIRFFGLDQLSPAERAIRTRAMELTLKKLTRTIQTAAEDVRVPAELTQEVVQRYQRRASRLEKEWEQPGETSHEDWVRMGLSDLTHEEREAYLRLFEERWVDSRMTRMLLDRVEDLLDGIREGGIPGYESSWRERLGFNWKLKVARQVMDISGVSRFLAKTLSDRFEVMLFQRRVLNSLLRENLPKLESFLGGETARILRDVLRIRLDAVKKELRLLELQYPGYARLEEKRYLRKIALRLEDAEFRELRDHSLISREVFRDLENELDAEAEKLEKRPELDLGLEPEKLVARVPLFAGLSDSEIRELSHLLRTRLAVPGERIVRKGDLGDALFFISSGSVEVVVEPRVWLGTGDFFGEIALIREQPRVADVVACGYCNLLLLKRHEFKKFVKQYPELEARLERTAGERLEGNHLV